MTSPLEILNFWFADSLDSVDKLADRQAVWFVPDSKFDNEIRARFQRLPDLAMSQDLVHWENNARNTLALVLVLDQFPRNMYRNTAQAFDYDNAALDLARKVVDQNAYLDLHPIEQVFLFLPFEHSEAMDDQIRAVDLYRILAERCLAPYEQAAQTALDYANRHYNIIERFGRFPHRNAILGRVSTPEEKAFLESGGDTFGVALPVDS